MVVTEAAPIKDRKVGVRKSTALDFLGSIAEHESWGFDLDYSNLNFVVSLEERHPPELRV
jgi:hypothetical protein